MTVEQQIAQCQPKPDVISLFKLGDFYEAFDADAMTISRELQITLTSTRGEKPRAMAGIPAHAVERYAGQLRDAGYTVELIEASN